MAVDGQLTSTPWSTASAVEIAQAAGASDLFVFRRIAHRRFVHVGGVGRGAGWAGIVEIEAEEEPLVKRAFSTASVLRCSQSEPWHVLGPYYGHAVAVVTVSADVFVVFGAADDAMAEVSDDDLLILARFAGEALVEIAPAKRLADELEALSAVRELLRAPPETLQEALQRLVDTTTAALSCDLGLLYIREQEQIALCDRREGAHLNEAVLLAPLSEIAERGVFPICVQRAEANELQAPFSSADGVLAYYLLEIKQPLPGALLLLHTRADTPRGFTLLCQSLGARLVETAEPLLAAALLRDKMNADLQRAASEARREPLTGVANRLAWNEALSSALASAASPASIVLLDCRGLKSTNDVHGHHVGDELLCRLAGVLNTSIRTGDLVARLGGDEFAILLYDADEAVTHTILDRIEAALAVQLKAGQPAIELAIGTSTSRDGDLDAAQRRADLELLEAKRVSRESSHLPPST